VTKIHNLVLADRRLKIREIDGTVGMSKESVGHILQEILGMRKLSGRWVPRLLTPDNKRSRETAELQKIRTHLAKKKVLFHHENAPAHTSALAKAKLVELGYELLPHPPYSPDLAV